MTANQPDIDEAAVPPPVPGVKPLAAEPVGAPRPRPGVGRLKSRLFGKRPPGPTPAARSPAPTAASPPTVSRPAPISAVDVLTDEWFDDLLRHLDQAGGRLRAARHREGAECYDGYAVQ